MLYLFPVLTFFSWPVLVPLLLSPKTLLTRLPRLSSLIFALVLSLISIRYNTLIHPFLLADNRHYTFYVFRLIRYYPLLRYLLAPIYVFTGFLVMASFGGASARIDQRKTRPRTPSKAARDLYKDEQGTIRTSFLLIWLITCALTLVTSPLVEPRYFILPWLMWRITIPGNRDGFEARTVVKENSKGRRRGVTNVAPADGGRSDSPLTLVVQYVSASAPGIEIVWNMVVNAFTCYLFLYRTFTWVQEPGVRQRFMW